MGFLSDYLKRSGKRRSNTYYVFVEKTNYIIVCAARVVVDPDNTDFSDVGDLGLDLFVYSSNEGERFKNFTKSVVDALMSKGISAYYTTVNVSDPVIMDFINGISNFTDNDKSRFTVFHKVRVGSKTVTGKIGDSKRRVDQYDIAAIIESYRLDGINFCRICEESTTNLSKWEQMAKMFRDTYSKKYQSRSAVPKLKRR